jgi:5-methylcytosine-specific restriction endonuclease McrA
MPGKRCTRCNGLKPPEEFDAKRTAGDGLSSHCKACRREALRLHYRNNKDAYLERNKRRVVGMRQVVWEAKSKPCSICGASFHPAAMDLHHVRGKKRFVLSHTSKASSMLALNQEIAKCNPTCSNCHRVETYRLTMSVPR